MKRNIVTIAAVAATAVIFGTTGAVAGSLVTSSDIADGTIKMKDLRPGLQERIRTHAQDGVDGQDGAPGADGQDGAPGTVAGVQTNWVANDNATINGPHSVTVSNPETAAGSSVEIEDLNKRVQALQTISFTYDLNGGATYGGGSPRVFFQIGEVYYNTFDADPADAGVDNGDGTFTKTVTVPANGTIHAMGVVQDSGVGSIVVTDLTVNGAVLSFS